MGRLRHTDREKWNFGCYLIDAAGWPLGMGFVSSTTILAMFLATLGANNVMIGLMPAIASLGAFLPQIFIANKLESMPIKKNYVVTVGFFERLPYLAMVPIILAFAKSEPGLVMACFFVLVGLGWLGQGFNIPAYYSAMCKVVPSDRRGRLYGYGGAIGGILGMLGAWGAGIVLTRFPYPIGYAVCFATAFTVLLLTVIPIGLADEPHEPREGHEPTFREYIGRCTKLLKGNKAMQGYTLLQILISIGGVAAAFYTVHSLRNLQATTAQVAIFNGLGLAVATAGNLAGGIIADRMGHKRMNELACILLASSALSAMLAPNVWLMFLAFGLYTLSMTAVSVSGATLLLDFAPQSEVPTYTAITGTLSAPFRFVAPIAAGWLADLAGYQPVFALAAVAAVLGWVVVAKRMSDPRKPAVTGVGAPVSTGG